MDQKPTQNEDVPEVSIEQLLRSIDSKVEEAIYKANHLAEPVRTSTFKRFPVLFTLLVSFGVAATFYAFEQLLASYPLLADRPWLILLIGVSVLAGTGTLYKKLG